MSQKDIQVSQFQQGVLPSSSFEDKLDLVIPRHQKNFSTATAVSSKEKHKHENLRLTVRRPEAGLNKMTLSKIRPSGRHGDSQKEMYITSNIKITELRQWFEQEPHDYHQTDFVQHLHAEIKWEEVHIGLFPTDIRARPFSVVCDDSIKPRGKRVIEDTPVLRVVFACSGSCVCGKPSPDVKRSEVEDDIDDAEDFDDEVEEEGHVKCSVGAKIKVEMTVKQACMGECTITHMPISEHKPPPESLRYHLKGSRVLRRWLFLQAEKLGVTPSAIETVSVTISIDGTSGTYRRLLEDVSKAIFRFAKKIVETEPGHQTSFPGIDHHELLQACRMVVDQGRFKPAFMVIDGCTAESKAILEVWPDMIIRACQFHVMQALRAKVRSFVTWKKGEAKEEVVNRVLESFRLLQRCNRSSDFGPSKELFSTQLNAISGSHGGFVKKVVDYLDATWLSSRWQDFVMDWGMSDGLTRTGLLSTNNHCEGAFRTFDRVILRGTINRRNDHLLFLILFYWFPRYRNSSVSQKRLPKSDKQIYQKAYHYWESGYVQNASAMDIDNSVLKSRTLVKDFADSDEVWEILIPDQETATAGRLHNGNMTDIERKLQQMQTVVDGLQNVQDDEGAKGDDGWLEEYRVNDVFDSFDDDESDSDDLDDTHPIGCQTAPKGMTPQPTQPQTSVLESTTSGGIPPSSCLSVVEATTTTTLPKAKIPAIPPQPPALPHPSTTNKPSSAEDAAVSDSDDPVVVLTNPPPSSSFPKNGSSQACAPLSTGRPAKHQPLNPRRRAPKSASKGQHHQQGTGIVNPRVPLSLAAGDKAQASRIINKQNLHRRRVLDTLRPGAYMMCEVYDLYVKLLRERARLAGQPHWALTTLTSSFLTRDDPYSQIAECEKLGSETEKINLFNYFTVSIPIYTPHHWHAVIVNMTQRRIEYFDSFHGSTDPEYTRQKRIEYSEAVGDDVPGAVSAVVPFL
ncbi:hypothetical protein L198_00258 [Cryptococcus wingfieldii CBS 7118]|uniref:Ubiquitin-like protease family profile domain-containing protein n=1 Tax=Cryptococcus wingfieldii CBS 7118 TaxID=1295528 RepID=A0A1E3K5S6_9TREE|nr:hypothetical protein L198_00258 [Cryptococcus wingfieldii CBS 7118]ODO08528.1 hypothetical protein L198_00258 [Cryptococcus wingfieldii CBS 7118]